MDELEELKKLRRLKELESQVSGDLPKGLGAVISTLKTGGEDVARGVTNAVAFPFQALGWLKDKLPHTPGEAVPTTLKDTAQNLQNFAQENFPVDPNESTLRKYGRVATEAVGGGAVLGPVGMFRAPVTSIAANAMGGVGAEAGAAYGRSIDPKFETIASILGGFAGGGGTAFGMSQLPGNKLALSTGQKRLNEATRGLSPQQWDDAAEKVEGFNRVGSTTATLPDAFPRNSPLTGIAEEVRGSRGGEALANKLNGREADIQNIAKAALAKIGPEVDVNTTANKLASAADAHIDRVKGIRSDDFGREIAGIQLKGTQVIDLQKRLRAEADTARRTTNPSYGDALEDVAAQLSWVDSQGRQGVVRDLQSLSSRIKEFKKNPTGPRASTGAVHSDKNLSSAVSRTEELLGQLEPKFAAANANFRTKTKQIVEPLEEGAIGRLSDSTSNITRPTPASRLHRLMDGNSPQIVGDTARVLENQTLTAGNSVAATDIARAWTQGRMKKTLAPGEDSPNPAQSIRGYEEQLAALLTAGGKNPSEILGPLKVTDDLQGFMQSAGSRGTDVPSLAQAAISPQSLVNKLTNIFTGRASAREIAEVFKNPNNLAQLRQIAEFDPNVRRMLIATSMVAPQVSSKER